jgi:hypothetical protein
MYAQPKSSAELVTSLRTFYSSVTNFMLSHRERKWPGAGARTNNKNLCTVQADTIQRMRYYSRKNMFFKLRRQGNTWVSTWLQCVCFLATFFETVRSSELVWVLRSGASRRTCAPMSYSYVTVIKQIIKIYTQKLVQLINMKFNEISSRDYRFVV